VKTNLSLALIALSLAGCGGPLVYADLEDQEICFVKPNQSVPALDIPSNIPVPADTPVDFADDLDLSDGVPGLDKKGAVTGILQITSLSMHSQTSMDQLDSGSFDLSDVATPGTSLQHISYAKPAGTAAPVNDVTFVVAQPSANLVDPLTGSSGKLHFSAEFRGKPPTKTDLGGADHWNVDITVCVYAKVKVDATKL
jgi:hypothetical protein